ncbi:MAG TPA: amino acid adenylation domain-containing protein, partial [Thermoanaerobaculia bacterium]
MARDGAGDARTAHHIEERYPLTPVQKGILFHSLLDEQSRAHVLQLVATFDEDVDAGEIEKAWRTASAAHPVLRTRFRVDGAEPEAELLAGATYNVERVEAGDINSFLEADRRRGLEPSHLPVMRFALVGARRLIWTFHHALLDSESALAILRDVVALMRGALPARPRFDESQPPSHDPHQSEAFWRETLRGFTAPTPLPGARVSRTHSPDFVERAVELGDLATRLRAFANTTEVDLETVIAGVWGMLLSRYSGEGDVVFGLARIRRPGGSTGMFIRTIPMRMTLPDKAVAIDSLRALQALRDTASEHEHIPLVRIQKLSEVSSGGSLFDSLLVFERRAPPDGVQVRIVGQTTYPLTLTADTESLAISIAYDRSHLDEAIVDSIPGHLRTMLAAVLDEPQSAIASVPILTEAERRRIVTEWNETASDYPRDRTIHSLIEEQAERTPDGVAVRFEGETLTYGELDRRANVIARKLRDAGVGPDTLVAIMMERSLSMIAALVGILKAGGAYVPLDPTYPKDRLAFMLEDSGAPVLVTDPALAPAPPREVQKVVIVENGPATEAATALPAVATPDNLAYVIYTSGSTGKPKGVQIPHRAVINFLESMRRVPGLTADDVLLGVTTLSFDICGLEMYLPLTTGACLELVSRTVAADGRRLAEELDRSGATVMQATPATWRMLIDAGWRGDKSLKILCGGEAMSGDLANALLDRCGSLWNMYGPTETTIWSTVHRVTRGEGATVPIGKPIANTQVYLLDSDLSPVPAGVAGELHIGGDGLARGYLNRPDLTAQRFIDWNGRRLYKTGDAARYRADGTLEYLHRLDNQVKLRGYRIELGEIESALRKCNGVADAVAVVADCGGAKVL